MEKILIVHNKIKSPLSSLVKKSSKNTLGTSRKTEKQFKDKIRRHLHCDLAYKVTGEGKIN